MQMRARRLCPEIRNLPREPPKPLSTSPRGSLKAPLRGDRPPTCCCSGSAAASRFEAACQLMLRCADNAMPAPSRTPELLAWLPAVHSAPACCHARSPVPLRRPPSGGGSHLPNPSGLLGALQAAFCEPSLVAPSRHARCWCAADRSTVPSVQAAPMEVDRAVDPPASQPPLPCLITRLCGAVHRSPSLQYPWAAQPQVKGLRDPNATTNPAALSSAAAASHQGLGGIPPLSQPSPRAVTPHQRSHQGANGIPPPSQLPAASHAGPLLALVQPSPTGEPLARLLDHQVSRCTSQPSSSLSLHETSLTAQHRPVRGCGGTGSILQGPGPGLQQCLQQALLLSS